MTRSWVSGGKSSDSIDRLRKEITELEAELERLVETNKRRIFDWAAQAARSIVPENEHGVMNAGRRLDNEVAEIIARYDFLSQSIMDKQVLLNEKVDEQAKLDSLG